MVLRKSRRYIPEPELLLARLLSGVGTEGGDKHYQPHIVHTQPNNNRGLGIPNIGQHRPSTHYTLPGGLKV